MVTAEADQDEQLSIMIPEAALRLEIRYVPHEVVHPDPKQPRVDADDELKASIAVEGIRQPITVRPHPEILGEYQIIDGERRWRGAAGVQADIPVMVREDQDEDVSRLLGQLVSNTGKPLTPVEEARAFARMMELAPDLSVAELARRLGRPRTTIQDRLSLLELGPWLALIESGKLPFSHAIEHLVPIRGVPDKYHEQIIAKLDSDYRWERNKEGEGISSHDFGRLLHEVARHLFYPLAKTKSSYAKQPEFNTRNHDAECSCGGIQWPDSASGDKRRQCGNPDWWRPLDRKAKKEQRAAEGKKESATRVPGWAKLPAEASRRLEKYSYNARPGETPIVRQGKWLFETSRGEIRGFDPKVLMAHLDPAKLVLVEQGHDYGEGRFTIATTDAAALKAARESWQERWDNKRAELTQARAATIEKLAAENRHLVVGAGAAILLGILAESHMHVDTLYELAQLLEMEPPARKADKYGYVNYEGFRKWIRDLDAGKAGHLASAWAAQANEIGKTLAQQIEAKQRQEFGTLAKTAIAWPGTPAKKAKPAKGKKAAGSGKRTPAPVEQDEDLEEDEFGDLPPDAELDEEDEEEDWTAKAGDDLWDDEDED